MAGPEGRWEGGAHAGRRAALEESGIRSRAPAGDWGPLSGYRAGQGLAGLVLASRGAAPFTAVFVADGQMAPGLRRALREAAIRTAGQVAVAGFDGTPEAESFPPPLTTARQDFAATGRRSVRLLVNRIEGRAAERPTPWSDSGSSSERAPAPGHRLIRGGVAVRPSGTGFYPRRSRPPWHLSVRRGDVWRGARRGHACRAERVRPHVPGSDVGRAVRVKLLRGAAAPSVPAGHPASRTAGGPESRGARPRMFK
ncbi:substrate-binding domain-containing protein [Streptomyces roseolus]|uniref:substrate-binding domain-containing protein n=1 Tax=Streptomyces roseolus TaxID=67358 RepID=UPI003647C4C2